MRGYPRTVVFMAASLAVPRATRREEYAHGERPRAADLPARSRTTAHRPVRGRRQVFGLAGAASFPRRPTGRRFPGRVAQCVMTAFVPAHRCGAVPDSHRVPSCDTRALAGHA